MENENEQEKFLYTIPAINQKAIYDLGLIGKITITGCIILNFLNYWSGHRKSTKKTINGEQFVRLQSSVITKNFPMFDIREQQVTRIITSLIDDGFLVREMVDNMFTYVRLTDKSEAIFSGGYHPLPEGMGGSPKREDDYNTDKYKYNTTCEKLEFYEKYEDIPGLDNESENTKQLLSYLYSRGWKLDKNRGVADFIRRVTNALSNSGIMGKNSQGQKYLDEKAYAFHFDNFTDWYIDKKPNNLFAKYIEWMGKRPEAKPKFK